MLSRRATKTAQPDTPYKHVIRTGTVKPSNGFQGFPGFIIKRPDDSNACLSRVNFAVLANLNGLSLTCHPRMPGWISNSCI